VLEFNHSDMHRSLPLVSIVMPSLNQLSFIEEAINSVLQQSYSHLELIIMDGGSNDGTLSLLAKKQQQDSRLTWFSKQDTGPAEAINNALAKARGLIIGWLNSDDCYHHDAVSSAVSHFQQQTDCLLVYGQGEHINAASERIGRYPTLPPSVSIQQFKYGCFICQPTVFFQRSVFILLGKLNENLKTSFDLEYWMRAFSNFSERIYFIDKIQAFSRLHQDCITQKMRRTIALESMKIVANFLNYAPAHWLLSYIDELAEHQPTNQLWMEIDLMIAETTDYLYPQERNILSSLLKKNWV
jgi:glycosyltransferase involved in cell wall biosynthesis